MTTFAIKKVPASAPAPETAPRLSSAVIWWRHTAELELQMDYAGSAALARQAWDDTVARLMLEPSEALYAELNECLKLWSQRASTFPQYGETFLDALLVAAFSAGLVLCDYPRQAVCMLKQMLVAHRPRIFRRA